jgi:hypothetical protein
MGYDIHITRREYWSANEGEPITLAEWLAYVEQDPELTLLDNIDYDVDWEGADGRCGSLFYAPYGSLKCKYNEQIIDKMVQIASDLGAKVMGDDDEIYLGNGVVIPPEPSP